MSARAPRDDSFDFAPFECKETGEPYRSFRSRLYLHAAGHVDKSGDSWADYFQAADDGSLR